MLCSPSGESHIQRYSSCTRKHKRTNTLAGFTMTLANLIRVSLTTSTRQVLARSVSGVQQHRGKATLPDLPYDYNALEPVISAEIMQLHHSKHHQAYVNNLNIALEKLEDAKAKNDVKSIIELEPVIRFNGGGHINHSIFWKNLSRDGGEPQGDLLKAINSDFGSVDNMKARVSQLAIGVQGSGWAWLGICPKSGALRAVACPNQDPLEATTGLVPLFGIDVWEHAYYLQYKNVRPDYVNAIWKVANWKDVEQRFLAAKPK